MTEENKILRAICFFILLLTLVMSAFLVLSYRITETNKRVDRNNDILMERILTHIYFDETKQVMLYTSPNGAEYDTLDMIQFKPQPNTECLKTQPIK